MSSRLGHGVHRAAGPNRPTILCRRPSVWWLWRSVADVRAASILVRCVDRWLAVALTACRGPRVAGNAWAVTGEPTAYAENRAAWRGAST
ncbi:hypothetical protein QJS66_22160 [Kocuria rhizophila]|nr:hypothetical protein QJS66_22160 [Kocuria rhizophila]